MGKGDKEKRLKYWGTHTKPTHKKSKLLGIVRAKGRGRELSALLRAFSIAATVATLRDTKLRAALLHGARRRVLTRMKRVKGTSPLRVPWSSVADCNRAAFEVMRYGGRDLK
jgi:hypothetical protein